MPQYSKAKPVNRKADATPYSKAKIAPEVSKSKAEFVEIDKILHKHSSKIYNYVEDEMMRRAQHDGAVFGVLKRTSTNAVKMPVKKMTRKEKLAKKVESHENIRKEMLNEREAKTKEEAISFDDNVDKDPIFTF